MAFDYLGVFTSLGMLSSIKRKAGQRSAYSSALIKASHWKGAASLQYECRIKDILRLFQVIDYPVPYICILLPKAQSRVPSSSPCDNDNSDEEAPAPAPANRTCCCNWISKTLYYSLISYCKISNSDYFHLLGHLLISLHTLGATICCNHACHAAHHIGLQMKSLNHGAILICLCYIHTNCDCIGNLCIAENTYAWFWLAYHPAQQLIPWACSNLHCALSLLTLLL